MPAAYCFVEFKDPESAQKAMFQLNSKVVPGTSNRVRFKLNHASYGREHLNQQEYSIYVAGLSEEVDDYAFYQCFVKKFPSTVSAKVVVDCNGKPRGYGFVRFRLEEERDRSMVEMQRYVGLGTNPIHVSLAQAKTKTYTTTGTTSTYSSSSDTSTTSSTDYAKAWNQYNQQYYQQDPYSQWQNYNYYGGYPGYDMSQSGYDYSGHYDYGQGQNADYSMHSTNNHVTQQAQTGSTTTNSQANDTSNGQSNKDTEDDMQDPELTVDVEKLNNEFMTKSEEFYHALEESRWHPLDNVYSTISAH